MRAVSNRWLSHIIDSPSQPSLSEAWELGWGRGGSYRCCRQRGGGGGDRDDRDGLTEVDIGRDGERKGERSRRERHCCREIERGGGRYTERQDR